MIDEIQVQNLALIQTASLRPGEGLTVITGETGAGKSALLSALKLLMGERASSDFVRDGEKSLSVSARFVDAHVPSEAKLFLEDTYGDTGDAGATGAVGVTGAAGAATSANTANTASTQALCVEELVVTRKVSFEGRSRASLNGNMASAREIATCISPLIDLCGQFEHQQLVRPATHLDLLDSWARDSVQQPLQAYQQAYIEANEAKSQVQQVLQSKQQSVAQLDEERFVLDRIDKLAPRQGEYEELKQYLQVAENAESLARAINSLRQTLNDDDAVLDRLNEAAVELENLAFVDNAISQMLNSLRDASFALEDIAAQARDYAQHIDFDPCQLEESQQRFAELQGLIRAYGPNMDEVFARRERAAQALEISENYDEALTRVQAAADEAEKRLAQAASVLDVVRKQNAPLFAQEVKAQMLKLQMGTATLDCDFAALPREQWTLMGPSRFEFLYQPSEASVPRPLARIASGGEISRVMLAIKAVLGDRDNVDTLVFDEVDAGVGGTCALALADLLVQLAQTHQVIVVTHLPQVAVRGTVHYVVERTDDQTRLLRVEGFKREEEIARMLAGSVNEISLAHARELLEAASS